MSKAFKQALKYNTRLKLQGILQAVIADNPDFRYVVKRCRHDVRSKQYMPDEISRLTQRQFNLQNIS
jgi:hypothetical protein